MTLLKVAPPRGERGLKLRIGGQGGAQMWVAPPRGERGLKCPLTRVRDSVNRRSPSWGAWIEIHRPSLASQGQAWSLPLVGSVD